MMMSKLAYILLIAVAVMIGACSTPLVIPTTQFNSNLLVVEGLINVGSDSTIITLSRTVLVSAKTTLKPETKATITVENASATVATLNELGNGIYASKGLNLDNTKQYRLRIKTSNGKMYVSDLTDVKVTPPIDSIGYNFKSPGLQIYANTHDATNNSRYYMYTYRETWQFHTPYYTPYISDGTNLNLRTPAQDIYTCFATDTTTDIFLNSTETLSQDLVYQLPIVAIDSASEKVQIKYSILLQQVALTKDAYTFWQNLKKNTEQLGGIFAAQPTGNLGNIHNIADATEPVIGYISAGTIQRKRIYITRAQVPQSWRVFDPYGCVSMESLFNPGSPPSVPDTKAAVIDLPVHGYATAPIYGGTNIIGYDFAFAVCADCTLRGTKTQPSFWKN